MNNKIVLKEWSDGDWDELYLGDEEVFRGHSIPNFAWVDLLRCLGFEVDVQEVPSDEEGA